MIDIQKLPDDLQGYLLTEYRKGLRMRRADYIIRTIRPLLDQMYTLCQTDGNFNRLLDWMAHIFQYPNIKPQRGIVLVGEDHCGKTLFGKFLTELVGVGNVVCCDSLQHMRFNGLFEGATLITLEDCNVSQELTQIHTLISDNTITIRRRYHNATVVPSFHRVLVTTAGLSPLLNYSNAFQQRFTVIPCGTVEGPVFYEAMNDPNLMSHFRQYLMERQIDANGV